MRLQIYLPGCYADAGLGVNLPPWDCTLPGNISELCDKRNSRMSCGSPSLASRRKGW